MLTALGGWLDSRVVFETLPDGGLTIEEWKHRAALGRDHEVKVVYAGFLMPFGHRASLVKITERKFAVGSGGTRRVPVPAHVHHRPRAGEAVPRPRLRASRRAQRRPRDAVRRWCGSSPTVTPSLDPPNQRPRRFRHAVHAAGERLELPVQDRRDRHREQRPRVRGAARLHGARPQRSGAPSSTARSTLYNTHALVDREFDMRRPEGRVRRQRGARTTPSSRPSR